MRTRCTSLAVFALVVLTVACQPPAADVAELSEADIAAIEGMVDAITEADLAGDWDAIGAFLTEDFNYMPSQLPPIEGKAAWRKWVESVEISIQAVQFNPLEIDGRGDLAFVRGTISETYTVGDSPDVIEGDLKFIWILRKQTDGKWLIDVAMWNTDAPMPVLDAT